MEVNPNILPLALSLNSTQSKYRYLIKKNLNDINQMHVILKGISNKLINQAFVIEEQLSEKNINIIGFLDERYPKAFWELEDPPIVIFAKGDLGQLDVTIGIVGSRRCSSSAKEISNKIARESALRGIVIISGMAEGIDRKAHVGALNSGLHPGTAVLGFGFDHFYPSSNRLLCEEFLKKGGCVITEYLPETPPAKFRFPERNRLVAALAKVLVVAEAREKSGALITARLVNELGKEVFVIPGTITNPYCKGSNQLLLVGATPLLDVEQIFELKHFANLTKLKPLSILQKLSSAEIEIGKYLIREGQGDLDQFSMLVNSDVLFSTLSELVLMGAIRDDGGGAYSYDQFVERPEILLTIYPT